MPTADLSQEEWRDLAVRRHRIKGHCEIDATPQIMPSNRDGCYVQAWVWVPNPDGGPTYGEGGYKTG